MHDPNTKRVANDFALAEDMVMDALTHEISDSNKQSVPVTSLVPLPDAWQLPTWFRTYGRVIGLVLVGGGLAGLIAVTMLAVDLTNKPYVQAVCLIALLIGIIAVLFGGSRDYVAYRNGQFAWYNQDVPLIETSYQRKSVSTDEQAHHLVVTAPEYRARTVADKFYTSEQLTIVNRLETGTWNYGVESTDDDGNTTTDWSAYGYTLYDMQTTLPSVRFDRNGIHRRHVSVRKVSDEPNQKIALKAGFDTKIGTHVQKPTTQRDVVDLFTDDVLATIYDLFEQHDRLMAIGCDHTQVMLLWQDDFDVKNSARANQSLATLYDNVYPAMHELTRQLAENLDNQL